MENMQMQGAVVDHQPNGDAPKEKTFSEKEIRQVVGNYRQGMLELKAERDARQAQVNTLLEEIDELDSRIARTEGAALGLLNLIQPPQEQQPIV